MEELPREISNKIIGYLGNGDYENERTCRYCKQFFEFQGQGLIKGIFQNTKDQNLYICYNCSVKVCDICSEYCKGRGLFFCQECVEDEQHLDGDCRCEICEICELS